MAPLPPLEADSTHTRQLGGGRVRRRHVLFVPGYDPNAPRRYRELYRREGAKQAEISGYGLQVSPQKPGNGAYGWQVSTQSEAGDVEATFEFLTWEDIVRASMDRSLLATYWAMVRTVWIYASTGVLLRLLRLRPAPMIAAIYPVAMLLIQLALSLLAGWVVWRTAAGSLPGVVALGAAGIVGYGVAHLLRRLDGRTFAHYLMLDYAFTAGHRGQWPPALKERIDVFSQRINALRAEPDLDEVLVVGHSSGAQIAVAALAQSLRDQTDGPATVLSLLTIGQVIPMVSFLPKANELRRDLHKLSSEARLSWVDVSAPGDGGCFALTDPVSVSGVAPEDHRQFGPKVISAAFSQTMNAQWRKSTRYRFFRRHFQYLCAFDHPKEYDYFAITAGPRSLAARFAGRSSSASRIETPLSAYRDM